MYIFYFKKAAINAFIIRTKSVAQFKRVITTCRISKNLVLALVILDGGSFRCSAVIVYELK